MKNYHLEVNRFCSIKDKTFKKDFSSNFNQNINKKYSRDKKNLTKSEKNNLPKSTNKTNLKKTKESSQNSIRSYLTKNDIHINKRNTQNNKNISKRNNNNNEINIENKNKKIETNNKTNIYKSPDTQNSCLGHGANPKNKKKHVSRNHLIDIKNPQLTDFINNKKGYKKLNKVNNNNILKSNLGLLITNNPINFENDSLLKENTSYFEINNLMNSNNKKNNSINKSGLNEKEISSEDYMAKIKKNNINKKIEKSSLLNSIININRYLTNDVSKSKNKINRDKSNKIKSRKIYENQLIQSPRLSEDISKVDKNINNLTKSDFLQDNNINNNNRDDLINQCLNNDYYSSIRNSNNHNKILKKRNSFNLDEKIKINNKYIENILGLNTPRLTINDEFTRTFRFSPKIYNINHSIINENSDYNSSLTKRIKVSKAKLSKIDDDNLSFKNQSNKLKQDIEEISTKSKSTKNNNIIKERKNLVEVNEFKIIDEFDLMKEENKEIKDNCNNIFDENFDNKETQLNNYNSIKCENHEFKKNNRIKKRKNNYSFNSCIYSPMNIHNQYKTLTTQQENKYANIDCDIEKNNGQYLKTLEEENTSRIQEIKIKLNNPKKRNKSKGYVYSHHSPSHTFYKPSQYSNSNNGINFYLDNDYSCEKTRINNQKVYTKQIFSNYNFNSKSKEKIGKHKINLDNINKLINLENFEYPDKKCMYNNPNNLNKNNNVFQQNNFYTTNNFFSCSSKRLDENKNLYSPRIYVKPSGKRNNQISDSPKSNALKIENKENENKICKALNKHDKIHKKTKAYIKKSIHKTQDNKDLSCKVKMKVINCNERYKKYYNYLIKIISSSKKICFITKEIKKPKYMPKCKKNFITKIIYSFIHKPKSVLCFISKSTIVFPENNISSYKHKKNKDKNIIKANILDFSLEQKKETETLNENNRTNHNRIFKYISNEKNYHESFGEINLSFSTEELNSFRQKESTIEGVFSEFVNMNSLLMNSENEMKITFGPNRRNNNLGNFNNYESITFGRMINNISNYAETDRTERNERTSYKRDEIIREMKDNINLNLPIKLENLYTNESMRLNSERIHLNRSNNNKIKGMINSKDLINFTETLGSIFDKKMSGLNIIEFDDNNIRSKYLTYLPKNQDKKSIIENNNLKLYKHFENNTNNIKNENYKFNNNNEFEDSSYSNITFEKAKYTERDIEEEIRYLLNIITISNFNIIYEKILKILKTDNHDNIKYFADNIIKRLNNNNKKYNILYSFLCKNFVKEFENKEINEEVLCQILKISKKYDNINRLNGYEKYEFNLYKENIFNKIKNIKTKIYFYFHSFDNINKEIVSMIKNDLINYDTNNEKVSFENYTKYNIYEIILNYLEYCIDNVYNNKLIISNCNDFINKIISYYLLKNKNNNHQNKEIIDLILNLDNIVVENKNMYEIIGYLLYCLITKEIYNLNNFDSFFNKDEFTIINLAKILKYTFLFCYQNSINIPDTFKGTNLFKKKSYIFEKYSYN